MAEKPVAKTVQEYIDELPVWADGTPVGEAPLTGMQRRIWVLASAGKFFEGLVVFMTGVALPLLAIEFNLGATEKGVVSAAVLFGILVGAGVLGGLADRFGRRSMFIAEMAIFTLFLVFVACSSSFAGLVVCLFGVGCALGCDYPTAHLIIAESTPSSQRGRLVLGAFAFQALGAVVGTGVGFVILRADPTLSAWRWMYACAILPAALVLVARFFIPGSGSWLVTQGRIEEAERATQALLHRDPPYPRAVSLKTHPRAEQQPAETGGGYAALFAKPNRRALILASVPWFLQDLGTYGIGIFTPTILAATIGAQNEHARNLVDVINNDLLGTEGAALIDLLLIVGIVGAVYLADTVGRIRLQVIGFLGCAAGLLVASVAAYADGTARMVGIFAGFMLFNVMTNLGPNAMTYLLAGEVFPTRIRATGAGFAAGFAKLGAVTTSFLFPILLKDIGVANLLYLLVGMSLLGAVVTWRYGIETKGLSLEEIGGEAGAQER